MNRWIPTLGVAALAAFFAVPAIRHWREQPPPPPRAPEPLQSTWSPPDSVTAGGGGDYLFGLALAADGRKLVYPGTQQGTTSLWLHDLRSGDTRRLAATDGGVAPFWSPDASRIGFFAAGKLRAVDLSKGDVSDLADATFGHGGTWNGAGDIVFAPAANGPLMRRKPDGSIAPLTTVARANGETAHAWPAFLRDGKHIVFSVAATEPSRAGTWIAALDDPLQRRRLLPNTSQALVVADTLIYLADQVLVAQALNPATLELDGRAQPIARPTGRGPLGQLLATASRDVLLFAPPGTPLRQLEWVSRDGQVSWTSEPIDAWDLRVSPDGRRFVVTEVDRQFRTLDVMIRTTTQPAPTRLSLSTDADESAVWSPDGLRIAWAAQRRKILIRGAGAVLPEQTIASFETPIQVWDWSRDGRWLLIGLRSNDTGDDLWLQAPAEGATPQPYFTGAFNQAYGAIAPNGRSIAYASDESGQFDIYVDAFPKPASRVRVTTAGGTEPRWSADGRELYFRRGSELHAIVLDGSEVRSTATLFDAGAPIRSYDAGRDGRFLINVPAGASAAMRTTLIHYWQPTQ